MRPHGRNFCEETHDFLQMRLTRACNFTGARLQEHQGGRLCTLRYRTRRSSRRDQYLITTVALHVCRFETCVLHVPRVSLFVGAAASCQPLLYFLEPRDFHIS